MSWEEISNKVDKEIKIGTEVPKAGGGTRKVTKKEGDKIYMRTGVKTNAQKYTTKNMIKHAYNTISSGRSFTSNDLKSNFSSEFSQGGCVFSMTGGILVFLDEARRVKKGKKYEYVSKMKK